MKNKKYLVFGVSVILVLAVVFAFYAFKSGLRSNNELYLCQNGVYYIYPGGLDAVPRYFDAQGNLLGECDIRRDAEKCRELQKIAGKCVKENSK